MDKYMRFTAAEMNAVFALYFKTHGINLPRGAALVPEIKNGELISVFIAVDRNDARFNRAAVTKRIRGKAAPHPT